MYKSVSTASCSIIAALWLGVRITDGRLLVASLPSCRRGGRVGGVVAGMVMEVVEEAVLRLLGVRLVVGGSVG